jgi:hypothetical protein
MNCWKKKDNQSSFELRNFVPPRKLHILSRTTFNNDYNWNLGNTWLRGISSCSCFCFRYNEALGTSLWCENGITTSQHSLVEDWLAQTEGEKTVDWKLRKHTVNTNDSSAFRYIKNNIQKWNLQHWRNFKICCGMRKKWPARRAWWRGSKMATQSRKRIEFVNEGFHGTSSETCTEKRSQIFFFLEWNSSIQNAF